jgi:hypothetical protein
LATQFPDLAAQWHPILNGDLTTDRVVAGSREKVWWKCDAGPDHEWQETLDKRTSRQYGCRFCAGKKVSVTNSLATQFPDLVAQWHPTLNGCLTPDQVVARSHTKVWWQCSKEPTHEWYAVIKNRVAGRGCAACAEPGYNPTKPGTLYLLVGPVWGKVGISNVPSQRISKHQRGKLFTTTVVAVEFVDGVTPMGIEQDLCGFIAERTDERAPKGVDGYTESFPAWMLDEVKVELIRLMGELPEAERQVRT